MDEGFLREKGSHFSDPISVSRLIPEKIQRGKLAQYSEDTHTSIANDFGLIASYIT
jgi:hypothetical protein